MIIPDSKPLICLLAIEGLLDKMVLRRKTHGTWRKVNGDRLFPCAVSPAP